MRTRIIATAPRIPLAHRRRPGRHRPAHLLGRDGLLAADAQPDLNGGLHHRPRAKRVVQLFMSARPASATRSTTSRS